MRARVAREQDGAAMAEIYRPIVANTAISFEVVPPGASEMARRVAGTLPTHPWLVIEAGGLLAGYAFAHQFAERAAYAWSAETSIYVHPDRQRAGIGRALYRALLPILRYQRYRRVVAGATLPNPASVRLHASVGFRPIGVYQQIGWKLDAWHDVVVWQLDLDPGEHAPTDRIPFSEVPSDFLTEAFESAVSAD